MVHFARLPGERAGRDPDGPAVADDVTGQLSNAEFSNRVQYAAGRLWEAGVREGDVVAIKMPNRIELVIALFAAWRLGAAATPINPGLTDTEVAYQLADSGADVMVGLHSTAGVVVIGPDELVAPTATVGSAGEVSDDDLALLIYTSGTTGQPKGVELTHRNISTMAQAMVSAMGFGSEAHSLLILPLFHVNGIVVGVLSPLLAGGQATVAGRFRPQTFFDIVERVRPTYFSAVPAIYAMLAALPPQVTPDTGSLRFAACGAAPMPVELMRKIRGPLRRPDRGGLRPVRRHLRQRVQPR